MKVAIVGGGIAGLYSAWHLIRSARESGKSCDVTLFECSERIGGRILSQVIPPLTFRAELGAMRFHPMTHHRLRTIIEQLDIPTRPFDVPPPHLFVRGRALSPHEILSGRCLRCGAGMPFQLRVNERGRSPEDLLSLVMKTLFNDLSFPNLSQAEAHELKERLLEANYGPGEVWRSLRQYGMFENIPLKEIGFWNLLQHYLSNEAFQLVYHALSLESVIGNWNAAEAIPWFVSDFTGADLWMVPGGMSRIVERMNDDIKQHVASWKPLVNHRVTTCTRDDSGWTLKFRLNRRNQQRDESEETASQGDVVEQVHETKFEYVIVAVPLQAYQTITILNDGERWRLDLEDDIQAHRLFKAFLLYEHPWWVGEDVPGAQTGRTYTDLPLRQIYYFGPDWLKACSDAALQEASVGVHPQWSAEFAKMLERWEKDGLNGNGTRRRWSLVMASYSDEHHVNFWRPPRGGLDHGSVHFNNPQGMSPADAERLRAEMFNFIPPHRRIRVRTVMKIQQQLREIHGNTIEEPVAGVYMDWGDERQSYGGGWHTWRVGSDADSYYACKTPKGLYLCGEAFSRDQGWIEGALQTAEYVLQQLKDEDRRQSSG